MNHIKKRIIKIGSVVFNTEGKKLSEVKGSPFSATGSS